jgi:hypothetical protein
VNESGLQKAVRRDADAGEFDGGFQLALGNAADWENADGIGGGKRCGRNGRKLLHGRLPGLALRVVRSYRRIGAGR